MPTTVVFGDTSDGEVDGSNTVYATARAGSGLFRDNTGVEVFFGQNFTSPNYRCWEGFLAFDTSVVGSGLVTSATLELTPSSDFSTQDFVIEVRQYQWATPLTTGAWVAGASITQPLLATYDTTAGWTGTYKTFTDVAMAGAIDGSGLTKFLLNSDRHRLGTTPVGAEWGGCSSAEAAGTTSDPKLTVVADPPILPSFGAIRSRVAPQARAG